MRKMPAKLVVAIHLRRPPLLPCVPRVAIGGGNRVRPDAVDEGPM